MDEGLDIYRAINSPQAEAALKRTETVKCLVERINQTRGKFDLSEEVVNLNYKIFNT
jgi:hypothetical protein